MRSLTLHGAELPGVARAHANVADVSRLDDVVERLHRLLDRRIIVEPMALKNVNVVELQTLQAVLDALKDVLTAPDECERSAVRIGQYAWLL